MKDVDLLIFDCDGVLLDSELLAVRADVTCFAEWGLQLSEDDLRVRYTGLSASAMIEDVQSRLNVRLPRGFDRMLEERLRQYFEAELRPVPGMDVLLDTLACKRCVASSSTPERLAHSLRLVGLYSRFAPNIFSATQVARGKPAPDLFLFAADRMLAEPHQCMVIEDSIPGVVAAKSAGMVAVGFCGGSHCSESHGRELLEAGADAVAYDLRELTLALQR